jgi:hypothetical protein
MLGVCVTYKTGFEFDDWIYWTFIQFVTTFHKSISSTGHPRPHCTNPHLLQLNCQLLLASHYIASGWATQKTHPLPSNGYPLLLCIRCRVMCLLSCCLAMGLCITIWKNSYRYCIQRFICKHWQERVSTNLWLSKLVSMSWITHSVCDKEERGNWRKSSEYSGTVMNQCLQYGVKNALLPLNRFH